MGRVSTHNDDLMTRSRTGLLMNNTLPELSIDPQSVTVVVGDMATFQCAGPGVYLIWKINGGILVKSAQNDGLFVDQRESNNFMGIWQSNWTVLITSAENNGTTVQCVLLASGLPDVSSDIATLTVLPGSYSLCQYDRE